MVEIPLDDALPAELNRDRWEAGQRYINALRELDFRPTMALWVYDKQDEEFRLYIFSSLVGFKGAEALYELLYKAYYRNATPKELDPWIVAVFDINSQLFADIAGALNSRHGFMIIGKDTNGAEYPLTPDSGTRFTMGPVFYQSDWAYVDPTIENVPNARQQWRRFSEKMNRLAA